MSTFSELQRSVSYKKYITDFLLAFIISLISSSFIYFPLLIGLFITLNLRLTFVIPFLFFTQITHSFLYFSLIIFYFIYKYYLYVILSIKINKNYLNYISIILVYIFYFTFLSSYYTIQDKYFELNYLIIIYYILVEELLFILDKKVNL